jgi:uncharacterized protein YggE
MSRYVEVVGRGSAAQQPDRLDLQVGVSAVCPTVGEAITRLGAQVSRLGEVVRAHGIEDRDIRSGHHHVGEEYAGNDRPATSYRAEQGLTVRVRDVSSVSALVDALAGAIGDDFRMHGLNWAVSDESAMAARAREAALEDARETAAHLAGLVGKTLGELHWVKESGRLGGGPVRLAAMSKDAGFAAEPGENEITVSLATRWSLD